LCYLQTLLLILLRSGWFTLLERKVLRISQLRIGPNKVSVVGFLIPVVDFIKLSYKSRIVRISNIIIFSIVIKIGIRLLLLSFCKWYDFQANNYIIFYLMLVRRVIGYAILLPGLSTKRAYRILGIIRMFTMILRFEISLFLLVITLNYINISRRIYLRLFILPIIRVICILIFTIEINRHPFEIIEGESELVSGFNIELRSLIFIVFFLREIINITIIVFVVRLIYNITITYLLILCILLIIRSRFPRIRYDIITMFQWTITYFVIISIYYLC